MWVSLYHLSIYDSGYSGNEIPLQDRSPLFLEAYALSRRVLGISCRLLIARLLQENSLRGHRIGRCGCDGRKA